jgi:DNA polymerase V
MPLIALTFLAPSFATPLKRPLLAWPVKAGLPSPADDYLEVRIDLNQHLIRHPAVTFFVRVSGDSMTGAGIQDGDLLIVDRAAEVTSGCIVVARIHDEFALKRVRKESRRVLLLPENDYTLYGDMSSHVMQTLEQFASEVESHSIDADQSEFPELVQEDIQELPAGLAVEYAGAEFAEHRVVDPRSVRSNPKTYFQSIQEISSRTTRPWTSVRRKSRPAYR